MRRDNCGRFLNEEVLAATISGSHAHLSSLCIRRCLSSGKQVERIKAALGALTGKMRHGLVTVKAGRRTFIIDAGTLELERDGRPTS
jgi:hypothetical protein